MSADDLKTRLRAHDRHICHEALLRIEALERQLAEAEKDAARYRWLRDCGLSRQIAETASMSIGMGPFIAMTLPSCNQFNQMGLSGESADNLIDAAIKENQHGT